MRKRKWLCLLLSAALLLGLIPIPAAYAGYETGYRPEAGSGEITAHGVDLSTWQGHDVDFNKIKAQGYSFVILRAGYATTKDDTFEENYARAKAAGLHVGVYLYSYADDVQEALEEAAACKEWLEGKLLEYPVYYDLEDPEKHQPMTVSELTTLALAFMDEMAADGWLTGLYSCKSWYDAKYELEKIMGTYECWIAQYFNSGTYDAYERYTENYGMWQYSASGTVDGVPGNVDMNVAFRDYPTICRQYGFNGYPASGETLWLQGGSIPSVLPVGTPLTLEGRVISTDSDALAVKVLVMQDNGKPAAEATASVNTGRLELSVLNEKLKLTSMAAGTYTVRIVAKTNELSQTLAEQSLVISPTGVRLDGAERPVSLREGDSFPLTGVLTAAAPIESLTVGIHDRYSKAITARTVNPGTTEYDLSDMQGKLPFESLTMGSYQYRISVETANGTETLMNVSFNVWVRSDPVTVTDFELAESYLPGELTELTGSVSSTYSNLRQVTVSLYNNTGTCIAESKVSGRAKSVSLASMGRRMELGELTPGNYRIEITALNDAGPKTLVSKVFRIVPDAISLCSFEAPTMVPLGDTFELNGVVASDETPLRAVSVTVTDTEGIAVLSAAVLPETVTFDLADLNKQIVLSSLTAGEYTLRIAAENGSDYAVIYDAPFYIIDHADELTWDGAYYRPNRIVYSAGEAPRVWGSLRSSGSKITELSIEIYAESGRMVARAARSVNAMTVSLAVMNERLKLSALSEGTYTYCLSATNGSGTFVLVRDTFTLSSCSHSYVRSGIQHVPSCAQVGAVCDSRCMVCGAKVRDGFMIPSVEHHFKDGQCVICEENAPKEFTLTQATSLPEADDWVVLAVCREEVWYALNADGVLEEIDAPADGQITVPRSQVWRLRSRTFGGQEGLALVNAAGKSIHMDTDGMRIAYGASHSLLRLCENSGGYAVSFLHRGNEKLELSGESVIYVFSR